MSVGITDFRHDFPEFQDQGRYPNSVLNYWGAVANLLLQSSTLAHLWNSQTAFPSYFDGASTPRTILDLGVELFVGHNLALEVQAADAAALRAVPGTVAGPISGRSAGGVSVNYDASSGIELKASHFNLTIYGRRFINLARMVGTIPLQIGVGADPTGGQNGPGWAGPPPFIVGSPGSAVY